MDYAAGEATDRGHQCKAPRSRYQGQCERTLGTLTNHNQR
jgi:hypothetical protein